MAQRARPLSPFLHYRWQYTNTLSILHRITGVLLSLGFFLLVYWLAAVAGGPERYAHALATCSAPRSLQLVLFGAAFAFCYHLLNGIRHLFFDIGHGFELATARNERLGRRRGGAVVLALLVWFAARAASEVRHEPAQSAAPRRRASAPRGAGRPTGTPSASRPWRWCCSGLWFVVLARHAGRCLACAGRRVAVVAA